MVSNKALLAKRLQENTLKHQEAQKEHVKELKELKRNIPIVDIQASPHQPRQFFAARAARCIGGANLAVPGPRWPVAHGRA